MLCFHKVKVKIMARLVANVLERSPTIRTQLLSICMYGGKFELPMMDDGTFALFVGRSNYASLENKNPLVPSPSLSNSLKVCKLGVIPLVHLALRFLLIIFMVSKTELFEHTIISP